MWRTDDSTGVYLDAIEIHERLTIRDVGGHRRVVEVLEDDLQVGNFKL
jgi:hypothetical protein